MVQLKSCFRQILLIGILYNSACSERLNRPLSSTELSFRELVARSPIVLVGKVLEVRESNTAKQPGSSHQEVHRRQVKVFVENELRGITGIRTVDITSFVIAATQPPPENNFKSPMPGSRFVFFLDRDLNSYRTIVDLNPNYLPIHSGRHKTDFRLDRSLQEVLAEMLLTPGSEFSPEEFANSLYEARYQALGLARRVVTARLLMGLSQTVWPPVRETACLILAGDFPGQDTCINSLMQEGSESFKARAQQQRKLNEVRDQKLLVQLKKAPASWVSQHADLREPEDVRDLLLFLLFHKNVEIAERALTILRNPEFH